MVSLGITVLEGLTWVWRVVGGAGELEDLGAVLDDLGPVVDGEGDWEGALLVDEGMYVLDGEFIGVYEGGDVIGVVEGAGDEVAAELVINVIEGEADDWGAELVITVVDGAGDELGAELVVETQVELGDGLEDDIFCVLLGPTELELLLMTPESGGSKLYP